MLDSFEEYTVVAWDTWPGITTRWNRR